MDRLNKLAFFFLLFLGILGCGVKGSPLPPLNPAPLGRGEPLYKEGPAKKTLKKQNFSNQDNEENPAAETEEK